MSFFCSAASSFKDFRASSASCSDCSMLSERFLTIPVIMGKPNFARMKNTMAKISVIQKNSPKSGVMSDMD